MGIYAEIGEAARRAEVARSGRDPGRYVLLDLRPCGEGHPEGVSEEIRATIAGAAGVPWIGSGHGDQVHGHLVVSVREAADVTPAAIAAEIIRKSEAEAREAREREEQRAREEAERPAREAREREEQEREAEDERLAAARKAERDAVEAAEIAARDAWIREHGSARLCGILAEGIDGIDRIYLDERISAERPGWVRESRECGVTEDVRATSVQAEHLAELEEARATVPDAHLAWLNIEIDHVQDCEGRGGERDCDRRDEASRVVIRCHHLGEELWREA